MSASNFSVPAKTGKKQLPPRLLKNDHLEDKIPGTQAMFY
jgi:hypothetical protein